MANITQPINPRAPTEEIGMPATRGNEVVVDQNFRTESGTFDEFCKYIGVGLAGDVLVENADGDIIPYFSQQAGDYIFVIGKRVVASHTFPIGGLKMTTAGNLTWYGGR